MLAELELQENWWSKLVWLMKLINKGLIFFGGMEKNHQIYLPPSFVLYIKYSK